MTTETPRGTTPTALRPTRQHVTTAGTALVVALAPLVVGVLVAKGLGADPMTPVNALISGGGHRAGLPRAEWRRRGHVTLCRLRTVRRTARPSRLRRAAPATR